MTMEQTNPTIENQSQPPIQNLGNENEFNLQREIFPFRITAPDGIREELSLELTIDIYSNEIIRAVFLECNTRSLSVISKTRLERPLLLNRGKSKRDNQKLTLDQTYNIIDSSIEDYNKTLSTISLPKEIVKD